MPALKWTYEQPFVSKSVPLDSRVPPKVNHWTFISLKSVLLDSRGPLKVYQ